MWTEKGDEMKVLPWEPEPTWTDDIDAKTVYPDIIVHERGVQTKNLLVIEAKRRGPLLSERHKDYLKLCAFTDPRSFFKYRWGVHLHFGKNEQRQPSCRLIWFADGHPNGIVGNISSGS